MRVAARLTAAAMLLVPMTLAVSAQDIARPTLTVDQCQPLSSSNFELCCVALNRDQLLPADEAGHCPQLTTSFVERVMEQARSRNETAQRPDRVDDTTTGSVRNDSRNVNAGRGNGGEKANGAPARSEIGDADPGNSGGNNAAGGAGPGVGTGGGGGRGGK